MTIETLERISSPRGYSFSPYCSLYLPLHDGRCQGHGQELLTNTGFEDGDPPTGWGLTGAGASWARSNEQAYRGTYSGKLTRAGADCYARQDYAEYAKYRGLLATLKAYVYATVADVAKLRIVDGINATFSSPHSGVAGWELLSVSLGIHTGALALGALFYVETTDTSAYIDEATMKIGNIFMSHDHYGHPVQVLGAKWTPQGYWFDKVDDIIVVPDHARIQNIFDSPGGTIVAWIMPSSIGENNVGRIWDKAKHYAYTLTDSGAGTCKVGFLQDFDGAADGLWVSTDSVITYLKPQMVSISFNNSAVGNDPVLCIDGNPVAITESTTPVGTRVTDAANPLSIGNHVGTTVTFDGYINALWAFKGKMLSPVELRSLFLATKGRWGR